MSHLLKAAVAVVLATAVAAPSPGFAKMKSKGHSMAAGKKGASKKGASMKKDTSPAMEENRKVMMEKSKEANEKKSGM